MPFHTASEESASRAASRRRAGGPDLREFHAGGLPRGASSAGWWQGPPEGLMQPEPMFPFSLGSPFSSALGGIERILRAALGEQYLYPDERNWYGPQAPGAYPPLEGSIPGASAGGNFVPFEDIYPGGVPPESPPGSMFGGISPAEAARTLTTFHGGGTLPPSGPAPVSAPSYDPRMFHPHSQQPFSQTAAAVFEQSQIREEAMRRMLAESQQPYIRGKTTNVVPMDYSR